MFASSKSSVNKMLCCGAQKDPVSGVAPKSAQNTPQRHPIPAAAQQQQQQLRMPQQHQQQMMMRPPNAMGMNNDVFMEQKKPSGISEEVFRQLETVQNRYDSTTAAAFRAVQKSGEMVVRTLDPRQFIRLASETAPKINIDTNDPNSITSFVEIVKRPGQTLGLYIREGNGLDRCDGVFISRIAIDSAVYSSGCLQLGDEILAVNLVDVTRMSLDDVVIIMSIPRRLVLTTRRSRQRPGAAAGNFGLNGASEGKMTPPPVVVYKGASGNGNGSDYRYDDGGGGGQRRDYLPYRDARTLTWDRNPKPDRSDPKYFPVNSLPRQSSQPTAANANSAEEAFRATANDMADMGGMPPPMRELDTGYGPAGGGAYYPSPSDNVVVDNSASEYFAEPEPEMSQPGRGQRLLHRMAHERERYRSHQMDSNGLDNRNRGYNTLQFRQSYRNGGYRGRHYSGLDYASDTDALNSPSSASIRLQRTSRASFDAAALTTLATTSRSNSLPRTFQREALLRHPELSMEMDRLATDPAGVLSGLSTDDQMSDSGAISAPENHHRHHHRNRKYDDITSYSAYPSSSYVRRTPSTSAIYETLRRSKELRESVSSRPSSRLSMDASHHEKSSSRDLDMQYFSDSEHQIVSYGGNGNDIRRIRNRTLSGLDSMRMTNAPSASGVFSRPSSALSRSITPSFQSEKENGQNFVDFNPAEFIKYKSEVMPESGGLRLSGQLNLHLLSGRGLRTGGRSRRIRDLYCVVEVDHIHKARTVVRSGGINFDWDERFDLDLVNNLEVEFLVYSWDPQLRHRLCYRSSLRLATLFGKGQLFQQVALRLHPAGTLYLTLSYLSLQEAYDRARYATSGCKLFGVPLEQVLERELTASTPDAVPIIVRRCVDEIERRGLDIIGIYRLCGSASKKNLLRIAFEDGPSEIVDLSSVNVPDINVITALLKEYLRELPQPVFSSCLYQMLVDAMSVFLPDDPDGNAKLVFSILDCLPKANRNCLVHIMDHLSKVASQSSRNKMVAQNLALCFAPVLMSDFSAQALASSAGADLDAAGNISEPIQILTYLIEIWPKTQP